MVNDADTLRIGGLLRTMDIGRDPRVFYNQGRTDEQKDIIHDARYKTIGGGNPCVSVSKREGESS